jgi:hypothetical protein
MMHQHLAASSFFVVLVLGTLTVAFHSGREMLRQSPGVAHVARWLTPLAWLTTTGFVAAAAWRFLASR